MLIMLYNLYFLMNLSYGQKIYFWGVDLADDPSQGFPASWGDYAAWTNAYLGGSDIYYTTDWLLPGFDYIYGITSGDSLSGFIVQSRTIPEIVRHYAFFYDGSPYYGDDAFRNLLLRV